MYRLTKTVDGSEIKEILKANENQDIILNKLEDFVIELASNGDEYTSEDLSNLRENGSERIGNYILEVDYVNELTDEEIVKRGGGVCAHCHSDETDPSDLKMNEGYVTRILDCDTCGKETTEVYSLTGTGE